MSDSSLYAPGDLFAVLAQPEGFPLAFFILTDDLYLSHMGQWSRLRSGAAKKKITRCAPLYEETIFSSPAGKKKKKREEKRAG